MGDKRVLRYGDLEKILLSERSSRFIENDHVPTDTEIQALQEAYESSQYKNKLKWCLFVFAGDSKPFPAMMPGQKTTCWICGKDIMYQGTWEKWAAENPIFKEKTYKNHLAFGMHGTRMCLCLDCLVALHCLQGKIT